MSFQEYIKIAKIEETFIENDTKNTVFKGTIEEYLETVSNTEFEISLFKMFYTHKFKSILFQNIYGNYHKYQLLR